MIHDPFPYDPGEVWWLANVFVTISNTFSKLGDAAAKLLFVRGVASFFYSIDYWTWEAAIELQKLSLWTTDTAKDIRDRVREDGLNGLIESYAPGVAAFFRDPKGKVKDYLWAWSRAGYDLFEEPLRELNDWLEVNYPELWAFKNDPKQYILDRLQETHPELYDFALDPLGWVTTNIGDVLDAVRWFLRDPFHSVHWWLLKADSPIAPFWFDPWGTMLVRIGEGVGLPAQWWLDWPDCVVDLAVDKAEGYYERHRDRVYYLAEHALRFMWEGVW